MKVFVTAVSCSGIMIKVAFLVSQGSIATQLMFVGKQHRIYCKFITQSNRERILTRRSAKQTKAERCFDSQ